MTTIKTSIVPTLAQIRALYNETFGIDIPEKKPFIEAGIEIVKKIGWESFVYNVENMNRDGSKIK